MLQVEGDAGLENSPEVIILKEDVLSESSETVTEVTPGNDIIVLEETNVVSAAPDQSGEPHAESES